MAGQDTENVLSILTPAEVEALGGLPGEAVVGVFRDRTTSLEQFRANAGFLRYLHEVIGTAGPGDPELNAAAAQQGQGWLYIIDLRTPDGPMGHVPPEDIIGAFEVAAGKVVGASYWANEHYRAHTRAGTIKLPAGLRQAFFRMLEARYPSARSH